jgi:hypothetical protein
MEEDGMRAFVAIVAMLVPCTGMAAGVSCPPTVMDKGAVKTADGAVDPPWALHPFRFVSVFDGDPKHGAAVTPAEDLKEDRLVQIWAVTAGRTTLQCRYTGTSQAVHLPVPVGVKRCILTTMKDGDPPPALRCE